MRAREIRSPLARLAALALLHALVPSWGAVAAPAGARPPNLLVIIADDLGTDRVAVYEAGEGQVRTPNIDRLGRKGLVFENFWAMPLCSPTRAALLSGQYPHRTGIGTVVIPGGKTPGLSTEIETLPRALAPAGYTSAIVGKWHLSTHLQGTDHPLRMGFAHHRGSLGNLAGYGGRGSYTDWVKTIDGVSRRSTKYATTDTVDDAIEFAATLPEPWLLIVSFNAGHRPLHMPPDDLHGFSDPPGKKDPRSARFRAMVEAMDTEIGRLLFAVLQQHPVIFFLGDNGTEGGSLEKRDPRAPRSKGSLFESGIRVPFIVSHRSIVAPGRRVRGLANVTDLFATLVELAGIDRPASTLPPDSVSLVPYLRSPGAQGPRDWMLSEKFKPNGSVAPKVYSRTVRDRHHKLIRFSDGKRQFFDLDADPRERRPLWIKDLEGRVAEDYRRLESLLEQAPPFRGGSDGSQPTAG